MDSQTSGGNASARIIGLARGGGVGWSEQERDREAREGAKWNLFISVFSPSLFLFSFHFAPARTRSESGPHHRQTAIV